MKKILVVDDEAGLLEMLKLLLENAGYRVILARDGEEGFAKVKGEHPDLIITDILMPVMDGYVFYKELKKNEGTADIPVIVLTARGQMEDTFKVLGVDEFLEKPSEASVLLEKIADVLSRPKLSTRRKTPPKVLLAGTYPEILKNMSAHLKRCGCETASVLSGPDIISRSVEFSPEILIMEVQMEGIKSAADIVKAIRLMPKFKKIPLLLYNFYKVDELGIYDFQQKASDVDAASRACLEAGATEYIGRYSENAFLESICKYL